MISIAILTVSDSRTLENDESGSLLASMIQNDGHKVVERSIVKDDVAEIRRYLAQWIQNSNVNVIISTGGTGIADRDNTVEAHTALYEKHLDGFAVLFHNVSKTKIGVSTIQSRACAGVANRTCLFALPGSPSACRDAWEEIITHMLDINYKPCNLVGFLTG